jgi:hypothetical protein
MANGQRTSRAVAGSGSSRWVLTYEQEQEKLRTAIEIGTAHQYEG